MFNLLLQFTFISIFSGGFNKESVKVGGKLAYEISLLCIAIFSFINYTITKNINNPYNFYTYVSIFEFRYI